MAAARRLHDCAGRRRGQHRLLVFARIRGVLRPAHRQRDRADAFSPDDDSVTEILKPPQVSSRTKVQGSTRVRSRASVATRRPPTGCSWRSTTFIRGASPSAPAAPPTRAAAHLPSSGGPQRDHAPLGRNAGVLERPLGRGRSDMVAPLDTCGSTSCPQGAGNDMAQQSGLAWLILESTAAGIRRPALRDGLGLDLQAHRGERSICRGPRLEPRWHEDRLHDDQQRGLGAARERDGAPL